MTNIPFISANLDKKKLDKKNVEKLLKATIFSSSCMPTPNPEYT